MSAPKAKQVELRLFASAFGETMDGLHFVPAVLETVASGHLFSLSAVFVEAFEEESDATPKGMPNDRLHFSCAETISSQFFANFSFILQ